MGHGLRLVLIALHLWMFFQIMQLLAGNSRHSGTSKEDEISLGVLPGESPSLRAEFDRGDVERLLIGCHVFTSGHIERERISCDTFKLTGIRDVEPA